MGAAGGWVSKEALATTPKEVLRMRIWITALWASCCGGLHGVNTANISGIMSMSPFKKAFGFNDMSATEVTNWTGWAVSSMLLVRISLSISPRMTLIVDRDNLLEFSFLVPSANVTAGRYA